MNECDAVKTQDNGRGNGRRTGRAAVGLVSRRLEGLWVAPVVLLAAIVLASPAQAQDCSAGRDLIAIPEIRSEAQKLKAVLLLSDEVRSMWVRAAKPAGANEGIGFNHAMPFTAGRKVKLDGTTVEVDVGRCMQQRLRYLTGWNVTDWIDAPDRPSEPSTKEPREPIPGPTFRARIGDLVQISFRNQVDTRNFPKTLDRGDCDVATGTAQVPADPARPDGPKKTIKVNVYPRNNTMLNCLHGSSTSNIHFHGTHTTPGTTGDNVLISVRPALRVGTSEPKPTDAEVKTNFAKIFGECERTGSPTKWGQLPKEWQDKQEGLLQEYDRTAPYRGRNASLPPDLHLWPKNKADIAKGQWPQYSVGAFPYCFRLPDYDDQEKGKVQMAQVPGTHWYHAHVHGSTALNVANGLVGTFIIEGPYDDKLRKFYSDKGNKLEEKVLVIQQLSTSLGLLSAGRTGPPFLSVNGRLVPKITMKRGEVQMWRIVNGAYRSFVQFVRFDVPAPTNTDPNATKPCTPPACVDWRQTAQDGVQFAPANYEKVANVNPQFNMAGGNRVDLLVKAPSAKGEYKLQVQESTSEGTAIIGARTRVRDVTLLTVSVEDTAIEPPMEFIDEASFPPFPGFLNDIPADDPARKRDVVYDTKLAPTATGSPLRGALTDADPVLPTHTINGKLFEAKEISKSMVLNSVEEWTVSNTAVGIAHPFHIHINPFQVVEVFDPNSTDAQDPGDCYADPTADPNTWKPCDKLKLQPPFVWWDVRAIPAASVRNWKWKEPKQACDKVEKEPGPSPEYEYKCPLDYEGKGCSEDKTSEKQQWCTVALPSPVKIPGYFKMRSRFADFPGVFVQHCHILAHEDVGMMQFVQICPEGVTCPTEPIRTDIKH